MAVLVHVNLFTDIKLRVMKISANIFNYLKSYFTFCQIYNNSLS